SRSAAQDRRPVQRVHCVARRVIPACAKPATRRTAPILSAGREILLLTAGGCGAEFGPIVGSGRACALFFLDIMPYPASARREIAQEPAHAFNRSIGAPDERRSSPFGERLRSHKRRRPSTREHVVCCALRKSPGIGRTDCGCI